MRPILPVAAFLFTAIPAIASANVAHLPACSEILPAEQAARLPRALVPEDLARLRDVGPVDPEAFATPFFTISPNGRFAALQLRQADPNRNQYCLAMVIIDLAGKEKPRIVDEGGDLLLLTLEIRGVADVASGLPLVITPRWSPDGRWIAFLKRSHGSTQVWRAMTDGSGSAPMTHSASDVVDFRIGSTGSTIVYATRPGLDRARQEIKQEGLRGWHFDDRFVPFAKKEPTALAPLEREVQVLDLASGEVRRPDPAETALVKVDHELMAFGGAPAVLDSKGLSVLATDLRGGAQPGALQASLSSGTSVSCTARQCDGAMKPWWMPGNRRVRFFRREGWNHASTAIYEWNPSDQSVRRIYVTDDVLTSCVPEGTALICLRDGSLQPRRLEKLVPASGRREVLFDPNPEFANLILGKPERLHWRNAFGLETVADLVLPVGYRKGQRYPMVVVQYDTRGFLRGGTGDEYPIQAFANRGYAVLSFRRPPIMALARAKDFQEAGRIALNQFSDRRSVESSLEGGVRLAVDRGIADPRRIGVTGLSDGSATVMWTLIHSSLFAAAGMSTCCLDPTLALHVGPSAARYFKELGFPGILGRNDPFWKDVSLAINARRIVTPILLQLSDDEYLSSLESFTALREAGAPVDMFVFPDEHHVKWQPAHRLAVYRRWLDWFDYWLRGVRSDAPDRQADLQQWDRLRNEISRRQAL